MIPEELRAPNQWVAWRLEQRRKPDGSLVPTKVPYRPDAPTTRASSTDPATWGSYDAALAAGGDGIGFVFAASDPYVGADLDNCVTRNGRIHAAAHDIIRALDGYVEFSPSGTGLHIIVRGRIERGRHTLKTPWNDELALYASGRFFTVSGDGRGEIRDSQAALDELVATYFPDPLHSSPAPSSPIVHSAPLCGDDDAVLARVLADPRIAALWRGGVADHGGDHSAADLALASHLAFFCGNDAARVDALFRRSGLYRDKWNEPRGDSTYGAMTIARAMRGN